MCWMCGVICAALLLSPVAGVRRGAEFLGVRSLDLVQTLQCHLIQQSEDVIFTGITFLCGSVMKKVFVYNVYSSWW